MLNYSARKISLSFVSVLALTFALQTSPVMAMDGKKKDTSQEVGSSDTFDRHIDYYYENPFELDYMCENALPQSSFDLFNYLWIAAAEGNKKAKLLCIYGSTIVFPE